MKKIVYSLMLCLILRIMKPKQVFVEKGRGMLKESIALYVKENTSKIDLECLDTTLTAEEIAAYFQIKRNTVSYYLNQEVGKSLFKINTRPVRFLNKEEFERKFFTASKDIYSSVNELTGEQEKQEPVTEHAPAVFCQEEKQDVFSNLIGANGSLRKSIEQMKTSIFYPNTSLPVFLHGPTGVGKSYMARKIYEFAVAEGILAEGAPFVIMNCAQYANNIELLSSNLFGYVKGAFTGAYQTTKGLLEAANGGMLFLDEVHRLNSESQEKLFVFLDQGIFRRMGESEGWHSAKVRMIMATTENLHSNFLETFLRRVPIVIKIPSLKERGEQERLQFIYHFFTVESKVLNKKISISANVIDALLNHAYTGNIGDLENKVKYICATAYAREKVSDVVEIHFEHLPEDVVQTITDRGNVKIGSYQMVEISPNSKQSEFFQKEDPEKDYEKEMFKKLALIYEDFQREKYTKYQFEKKCLETIYDVFDHLIYEQNSENDTSIRRYIVNSVQEAFWYVEYSYNVQFGGNSLHAVIAYFVYMNQHHRRKPVLPEGFLDFILKEYQREAEIAGRMLDMLSCKLDIISRKEDLIPFTLYIRSLMDTAVTTKRLRVIVVAHGYATASSIAEVANRVLDENIFESVDMPIEKTVFDVVDWLKEYIRKNDVSHGVLLMVDMGSLKGIYLSFEKELKAPLAIINNVSTQMAIYAGEMIQKEKDLEEIIQAIDRETRTEYKILFPKEEKRKVILTCCITGTGTAEQLRQLIETNIPDEVEVGVISYDFDQLKNKEIVKGIHQKYEILGIIGTKNPSIGEEIFLPLEQLVSGEAEEMVAEMLRPVADIQQIQQINDGLLRNLSMNQLLGYLTILDTEKILKHIEEALKKYELVTGTRLANNTKINLFIHVGCLVERLIRGQAIIDYPDEREFKRIHRKEIRQIQSAFSVIEETYSVKIPISEIGYIFDIISEI